VRPPKVSQAPTLPFNDEEFARILTACNKHSGSGKHGMGNRVCLRALILLMRYSGLRIRDAATLERSRIDDGKLFLYTQKTGTPVWVPLPPAVVEALAEVESVNPQYFFWSGNGDPKSTVADWQRSFRRLLVHAKVTGHFHMLRDTAAVGWLTKGIPLETLSILLGHSSIRITEKHYAPWVKERQALLEAAVMKAW
jgi:integrase/recombinase XerD